jgi:hypothetical protein
MPPGDATFGPYQSGAAVMRRDRQTALRGINNVPVNYS